MATWITITGSLYDARTGTKVTQGRFHITPHSFIRNGNDIVSANTVTYDVPGTGNLNLQLAPSNGVSYLVEFDPDPTDTTRPMRLRSGYFTDTWTIPGSGPVDVATL